MEISSQLQPRRVKQTPPNLARGFGAVVLMVLIAACSQDLQAQQQTTPPVPKLPAAEKVVDDYLKAIGGRNHLALIRDATYEWTIRLKDQLMGTARTQIKSPNSYRSEMTFGNGQIIWGTNSGSAWVHGLDGQLRNLTGAESATAKLQAILEANHLLDFKKHNVMARSISVDGQGSEPVCIVEFSTSNGARLRYWFSLSSKLLIRIDDEARRITTRFKDYRRQGTGTNLLEPHNVSISPRDGGELTLLLERVTYNAGLADSAFNPPRSGKGDNKN
jgi:hypothetical protein